MSNAEFLTYAKQAIEAIEQLLFAEQSLSESFIRGNLEKHRILGTLMKKKQFLLNAFDNRVEPNLDDVLQGLRNRFQNHEWIPRCERCKNQISKLRNLVQTF